MMKRIFINIYFLDKNSDITKACVEYVARCCFVNLFVTELQFELRKLKNHHNGFLLLQVARPNSLY